MACEFDTHYFRGVKNMKEDENKYNTNSTVDRKLLIKKLIKSLC